MRQSPVNKAQMALLVTYMKMNTDLAKGTVPPAASKARWMAFATALNKKGPPTKGWQKWYRVWVNYKARTKANKGSRAAAPSESPENVEDKEIGDENDDEQEIKNENGEASTGKSCSSDSEGNSEEEGESAAEPPPKKRLRNNKTLKSKEANRKTAKKNYKCAHGCTMELNLQQQLLDILRNFSDLEKSLRQLVDLKQQELNILRREQKQRDTYRMRKLKLLTLSQGKEN